MTGRSATLDPRVHAVRRDLADVRLADLVFAPHYAAPAYRTLARAAALTAERGADAETIALLAAGDAFEVIEFAGDQAWGVAPARALVGYLDAASLDPAPA